VFAAKPLANELHAKALTAKQNWMQCNTVC